MIRFEFHRRPLSLMLVRRVAVPGGPRGYVWDRAVGVRLGYFPELDSYGARLLLWRRSVGACWERLDFQTHHVLRLAPGVAIRHYWRNLLPRVRVAATPY